MAEITREVLKARIDEYQANIYGLQGAIEACKDLIQYLDQKDALPLSELKDSLGMREMEVVPNEG